MIVSIIGRPNVGKSTIFNRLAGGKLAIVGDLPGVTRDRKYADADLFGLKIQILDTPGVDPFSKSQLAQGMNEQSFAAINESDIVLFVVDAIEGVTEYDKEIAAWIRSALKKIGKTLLQSVLSSDTISVHVTQSTEGGEMTCRISNPRKSA